MVFGPIQRPCPDLLAVGAQFLIATLSILSSRLMFQSGDGCVVGDCSVQRWLEPNPQGSVTAYQVVRGQLDEYRATADRQRGGQPKFAHGVARLDTCVREQALDRCVLLVIKNGEDAVVVGIIFAERGQQGSSHASKPTRWLSTAVNASSDRMISV